MDATFTKQILMTAPLQFKVAYDINPWMSGNEGMVDTVRAGEQWEELRNALSFAGADVVVMDAPPENCPDAVFTANAGINLNNQFFVSAFRHPERQVEEPYFAGWFKERGFDLFVNELHDADREVHSFEGAGDALFDHGAGLLWFGSGFRSTSGYARVLEAFAANSNYIVMQLCLADPRWYHLDTCFCPLDNGMVLWYPGAFDAKSQARVRTVYEDDAIEVSLEDALNFACNAVSVGDFLVTPLITDELETRLSERGITALQVDLSEFKKSGGSAKCLTLQVN